MAKMLSYSFNYYLNFALWFPYVVVLFLVACYSRLRYKRFFDKEYMAQLSFFNAASPSVHFSTEFLFQKALEGQLIINHQHFLRAPVLDVGIGEGTLGSWLKSFVPRINVGLDAMWSQSKAAAETGAYDATITGLAEELPFQNESLGSVLSVCVMEHVLNLDKAFQEIHRVLRPGGYCMLTVISDKHNDGLLLPFILDLPGLRWAKQRYINWFNKVNYHHRPTFGIQGYETMISDRFNFIIKQPFWDVSNRRLYDLIGLPSILFGYKYGNTPIVHFMLRDTFLKGLTYRTNRWLLTPRLILDERAKSEKYTHIFFVLEKKANCNVFQQ